MKIIVIGAGQGGLRAASLLAENGANVTVYEKKSEDNVAMNWFDGISTKFFDDLNIKVPEDSFKGAAVSFIGPGSDKPLYIWTKAEDMDWSVNRQTFTKQLVEDARARGAKVIFNTPVENLIQAETAVYGVVVEGKEIYADLVIDSSGMNSPFRFSLSERAGITPEPEEDDVFNVYRGIYNQVPGFKELPENQRFKMFLKYQGKKSISWCGVEPSGELNVLVGMIGKLTLNDFNQLYAHLKMDNPIIDDVKDGRSAEMPIPVRYPLTRFAFPGYAAIGDCAFMTIPIMGSGIENSIRAGQMLAEAIIEDKSTGMKTLWKYQVRYYKKIAAVCYLLDWCKRGLLASDNDELKGFMESGAVRDEDIKAVMSGNISQIPVEEWLKKPAKFFKAKGFINPLMKYVVKGLRAALTAYSIPENYDRAEIDKWVQKAEKAMKK